MLISDWSSDVCSSDLFKLLPGDPTSVFVDSNFSDEMIRQQRKLWGLDQPIWVQYFGYMRNMLTFDFGTSFFQYAPVNEIVAEKLLHTAAMIVTAIILSIIVGSDLGVLVCWHGGSRMESEAVVGLLSFRSAPWFFVALL